MKVKCMPFGSKIYISQIYKESIGGFIPLVVADERLLGYSPVGDVEIPLPHLLGHNCGLPRDAGLCQEGWDGKIAQGFEA